MKPKIITSFLFLFVIILISCSNREKTKLIGKWKEDSKNTKVNNKHLDPKFSNAYYEFFENNRYNSKVEYNLIPYGGNLTECNVVAEKYDVNGDSIIFYVKDKPINRYKFEFLDDKTLVLRYSKFTEKNNVESETVFKKIE